MNSYLQPVPAQGLRVKLMFIADTGTYEQQHRRPYESVVSDNTITMLQDRLDDPRRGITPNTLSGITNSVLQPQLQPERPIHIVNGWHAQRFRWLAITEHTDRFGVSVYEMIQGYTDDRGISYSGALNPDMTFYIGSVLTMRRTLVPSPLGNRDMFNVVDAVQVLAKSDFDSIHGRRELEYRMKPTDIFTAMDRTEVAAEMQERQIQDTRSLMTTRPTLSRRQNGVASEFVASVLEGYKNASLAAGFSQSEDTVLEHARGDLDETPITHSAFARQIAGIRGVPNTQFFTWKDLCALDANVQRDEVTTVTLMGTPRQVVNSQMNIAGRGADWGKSDTRNPQLAQILAQSVPALMMKFGFAKIHFSSTNRTHDGRMQTAVMNYQDFPSMVGASLDMTNQIMVFTRKLESDVLVDLSMSGRADFAITVASDLLGETIIELEFNGSSVERYVVPSFADSLLTPLVTADPMRSTDIAKDFQKIFRDALPGQHNAAPYIQSVDNQPTGGFSEGGWGVA